VLPHTLTPVTGSPQPATPKTPTNPASPKSVSVAAVARRSAPATYASLMSATRDTVAQAARVTPTGRPDTRVEQLDVLAYVRFLRYAGVHLDLLHGLSDTHLAGLPALAKRLISLPTPSPNSTHVGEGTDGADGTHSTEVVPWVRATQLLGAATDLLGTHVGPDHQLLTTDLLDVVAAPGTVGASRQLLELLVDATAANQARLAAAARTTRGLFEGQVPNRQLRRAANLSAAAELRAKAALWELNDSGRADLDSQLVGLTVGRSGRPDPHVTSTLQALRTLRTVSLAQRRGQTPVSVTSLRELIQLGLKLTDPTTIELPAEAGSLDRVNHAHRLDQLQAAHDAWQNAEATIAGRYHDIALAARPYGNAIRHLLGTDLSPAVRAALMAALPGITEDSVRGLHATQAKIGIAAKRRELPHLALRWRPATPLDAGLLGAKLGHAAHTTAVAAQAAQAARPEASSRRTSTGSTPHQTAPAPVRRGVEPTAP
jgi:hypothetical protein